MSHNSNLEADEIDLREVFAALWSNKFLITLFTGLSIFLAGNHVITTEKRYMAKSIFQIEGNDSSSNINIPGELGALVSLTDFAQEASSTDALPNAQRVANLSLICNKIFHLIEILILTNTTIIQITKIHSGKRRLKELLDGKKKN